MKMVPCEKTEIQVKVRYSDIYNLLLEFIESGNDCVRIEGYPHKNADSAASAFRSAAKRYHLDQIQVMRRGEKVFLIRKF